MTNKHTEPRNELHTTPNQTSTYSCDRRGFLKGAALAVGATASAAILAACGTKEEAVRAAAATIPVGGAVVLDRFVVSQPTEGEFIAFSRTCPHQAGDINQISETNGRVVAICAKHQSEFDVTTGEVLSGPSRDGMTPASSVTTEGNDVVIS